MLVTQHKQTYLDINRSGKQCFVNQRNIKRMHIYSGPQIRKLPTSQLEFSKWNRNCFRVERSEKKMQNSSEIWWIRRCVAQRLGGNDRREILLDGLHSAYFQDHGFNLAGRRLSVHTLQPWILLWFIRFVDEGGICFFKFSLKILNNNRVFALLDPFHY